MIESSDNLEINNTNTVGTMELLLNEQKLFSILEKMKKKEAITDEDVRYIIDNLPKVNTKDGEKMDIETFNNVTFFMVNKNEIELKTINECKKAFLQNTLQNANTDYGPLMKATELEELLNATNTYNNIYQYVPIYEYYPDEKKKFLQSLEEFVINIFKDQNETNELKDFKEFKATIEIINNFGLFKEDKSKQKLRGVLDDFFKKTPFNQIKYNEDEDLLDYIGALLDLEKLQVFSYTNYIKLIDYLTTANVGLTPKDCQMIFLNCINIQQNEDQKQSDNTKKALEKLRDKFFQLAPPPDDDVKKKIIEVFINYINNGEKMQYFDIFIPLMEKYDLFKQLSTEQKQNVQEAITNNIVSWLSDSTDQDDNVKKAICFNQFLSVYKTLIKHGIIDNKTLLDMFNKINPANNTLKPKLLEINIARLKTLYENTIPNINTTDVQITMFNVMTYIISNKDKVTCGDNYLVDVIASVINTGKFNTTKIKNKFANAIFDQVFKIDNDNYTIDYNHSGLLRLLKILKKVRGNEGNLMFKDKNIRDLLLAQLNQIVGYYANHYISSKDKNKQTKIREKFLENFKNFIEEYSALNDGVVFKDDNNNAIKQQIKNVLLSEDNDMLDETTMFEILGLEQQAEEDEDKELFFSQEDFKDIVTQKLQQFFEKHINDSSISIDNIDTKLIKEFMEQAEKKYNELYNEGLPVYIKKTLTDYIFDNIDNITKKGEEYIKKIAKYIKVIDGFGNVLYVTDYMIKKLADNFLKNDDDPTQGINEKIVKYKATYEQLGLLDNNGWYTVCKEVCDLTIFRQEEKDKIKSCIAHIQKYLLTDKKDIDKLLNNILLPKICLEARHAITYFNKENIEECEKKLNYYKDLLKQFNVEIDKELIKTKFTEEIKNLNYRYICKYICKLQGLNKTMFKNDNDCQNYWKSILTNNEVLNLIVDKIKKGASDVDDSRESWKQFIELDIIKNNPDIIINIFEGCINNKTDKNTLKMLAEETWGVINGLPEETNKQWSTEWKKWIAIFLQTSYNDDKFKAYIETFALISSEEFAETYFQTVIEELNKKNFIINEKQDILSKLISVCKTKKWDNELQIFVKTNINKTTDIETYKSLLYIYKEEKYDKNIVDFNKIVKHKFFKSNSPNNISDMLFFLNDQIFSGSDQDFDDIITNFFNTDDNLNRLKGIITYLVSQQKLSDKEIIVKILNNLSLADYKRLILLEHLFKAINDPNEAEKAFLDAISDENIEIEKVKLLMQSLKRNKILHYGKCLEAILKRNIDKDGIIELLKKLDKLAYGNEEEEKALKKAVVDIFPRVADNDPKKLFLLKQAIHEDLFFNAKDTADIYTNIANEITEGDSEENKQKIKLLLDIIEEDCKNNECDVSDDNDIRESLCEIFKENKNISLLENLIKTLSNHKQFLFNEFSQLIFNKDNISESDRKKLFETILDVLNNKDNNDVLKKIYINDFKIFFTDELKKPENFQNNEKFQKLITIIKLLKTKFPDIIPAPEIIKSIPTANNFYKQNPQKIKEILTTTLTPENSCTKNEIQYFKTFIKEPVNDLIIEALQYLDKTDLLTKFYPTILDGIEDKIYTNDQTQIKVLTKQLHTNIAKILVGKDVVSDNEEEAKKIILEYIFSNNIDFAQSKNILTKLNSADATKPLDLQVIELMKIERENDAYKKPIWNIYDILTDLTNYKKNYNDIIIDDEVISKIYEKQKEFSNLFLSTKYNIKGINKYKDYNFLKNDTPAYFEEIETKLKKKILDHAANLGKDITQLSDIINSPDNHNELAQILTTEKQTELSNELNKIVSDYTTLVRNNTFVATLDNLSHAANNDTKSLAMFDLIKSMQESKKRLSDIKKQIEQLKQNQKTNQQIEENKKIQQDKITNKIENEIKQVERLLEENNIPQEKYDISDFKKNIEQQIKTLNTNIDKCKFNKKLSTEQNIQKLNEQIDKENNKIIQNIKNLQDDIKDDLKNKKNEQQKNINNAKAESNLNTITLTEKDLNQIEDEKQAIEKERKQVLKNKTKEALKNIKPKETSFIKTPIDGLEMTGGVGLTVAGIIAGILFPPLGFLLCVPGALCLGHMGAKYVKNKDKNNQINLNSALDIYKHSFVNDTEKPMEDTPEQEQENTQMKSLNTTINTKPENKLYDFKNKKINNKNINNYKTLQENNEFHI